MPNPAKQHLGAIVQCQAANASDVGQVQQMPADTPSSASLSCSACRAMMCDTSHALLNFTCSIAYSSTAQRLLQPAAGPAAVQTTSCATPKHFNVTEMALADHTWAPCLVLPPVWAQQVPPTVPNPLKKHLGATVLCQAVNTVLRDTHQAANLSALAPTQQMPATAEAPSAASL